MMEGKINFVMLWQALLYYYQGVKNNSSNVKICSEKYFMYILGNKISTRATTRPPRPSSTAECLRLIARLRGEQASAASWEPRPPFEATEID